MKKTDIAMVILIASVTVIIAFVIGNQLSFLKPPEGGQKVKTATAISGTVDDPDPKVFNAEAINPTVQTVIGGNTPE